jgi:hypothetical protein
LRKNWTEFGADLLRLGWRPMALGLGAWLTAAAVALIGVVVLYNR